MPCLDANALDIDPEGMAFLRSVLKPDAGEPRPDQAPAQPAQTPVVAIPAAGARLHAGASRARRTARRPTAG